MAGGKKGTSSAIPSDGSELLFRPSIAATGIVAEGLALAGWIVLELGEVVESHMFPGWLITYGGWASLETERNSICQVGHSAVFPVVSFYLLLLFADYG